MALPVSATWKEAIKAQFRYPAYMRVLLTVAPPGMREGAVATSSYTESIASTNTLIDGNSDYCEPVATFEQNRWTGDGRMYLPSENAAQNKPIEWWSNTCQYSDQNPVTLEFSFDTTYSIPGLYVVWDTETNSWPTKITVTGYRVNGTVIATHTITSINQVEGYFAAQFDDVKRIVLNVHTWSKPNWRVRINEVVFGLYLRFGNDEIITGEAIASSTILTEELPKFDVSFTIKNYDRVFDPRLQSGYSKYLAVRQQVKVQWGFEVAYKQIEWMEPWPMYMKSWSIPADVPEVPMTATHRMDFITQDYTQGVYDGSLRNFYNLAVDVLQNSGIIKEESSEIPWELDAGLRGFVTRAPTPIVASNVALEYLANAAGFFLDTNPSTGYVRIRKVGKTPGYEIGLMQQQGDPAYDIKDRLKSISIGMRSFSKKSSVEEVYKMELHLSGSTVVTARFNSDEIVLSPTISITGAQITSQKFFARSALLTVVAPAAGADITITINGYVVEEFVTFVETFRDANVANGLEVEVDNPYITEMSVAKKLTDVMVAYYARRNHLSIPYMGYPELELDDTISVPTNYGAGSGVVVGTRLTFNGGFTGTVDTVMEV